MLLLVSTVEFVGNVASASIHIVGVCEICGGAWPCISVRRRGGECYTLAVNVEMGPMFHAQDSQRSKCLCTVFPPPVISPFHRLLFPPPINDSFVWAFLPCWVANLSWARPGLRELNAFSPLSHSFIPFACSLFLALLFGSLPSLPPPHLSLVTCSHSDVFSPLTSLLNLSQPLAPSQLNERRRI